MTIETTLSTAGPYVGNDTTDTFAFGFRIIDEEQLTVYYTDDEGVESILELNVDYTVTGVGEDNGGSVILTDGNLADDHEIYIIRIPEFKQQTDFDNQGDYFPQTHEDTFDLMMMCLQYQKELLAKCITFPVNYLNQFDTQLPIPVGNKILTVNSDNDGFEWRSGADMGVAVVPKNLLDFGDATGDGVADDTTVVQAANADGGLIYVPEGIFSTNIAANDLNGPFYGPGQIKDSAGYKRGKYFSHIESAPSSFGNESNIGQAFNGDMSKVQFAVEHRISGDETLGQPDSDYLYTPEAYAHFGFLHNTSGYNHSTSGADGRTAACYSRVRIYQAGQGDCVAYNASGFVTGTRAGSTHFLANPAGSLFNGDLFAGADGVYLNPYEITLHDGGYDVAAIGQVLNFNRTESAGAKSAIWSGSRYQSIGSEAVDNIIAANGKFDVGIDLSMAGLNLGANLAAISLRSTQRVYWNNTAIASGDTEADWRTNVFNATYTHYSGDVDNGTGVHTVVNSVKSMSVREDAVLLNNINGLVLKNTGIIRLGGTNQYGSGSQSAAIDTTNFPGSASAGITKWVSVVLGADLYAIPALKITS